MPDLLDVLALDGAPLLVLLCIALGVVIGLVVSGKIAPPRI